MKQSFYALVLLALAACNNATEQQSTGKQDSAAPVSKTAVTVPAGFSINVICPDLGHNRHLVVNSNGDVYVKLDKLKDGKGILVLRDVDGNGTYKVVKSFGDYTGTGIAIKDGYLYASSDEAVYRYKLVNNEVASPEAPEKIVTGLVNKNEHTSKSITLDNAGHIYVNIGAPSNSCQVQDRTPGSPAQNPCPILETAGGIWQFSAAIANQSYAQGIRYATGLRNVVGLDWNTQINELFVMQHGRDQLHELFPDQYDEKQSAELPAEEFFMIKKGSDCGWPYCYYDGAQQKKVLAPEYGGDGKKQDICADKTQPIMAFPAHWAPNALLFYTGSMFPERYKNGAFIAFHGSWNRAPLAQAGYKVVFVPFKDGKPSGNYEVFADGFTGAAEINGPGQATYRPCGLAQGPDGALYISDDKEGRIWKVTYTNK